MDTTMLALVFFSALFLFQAESTSFTFTNNCPFTVWPATQPNSGIPPLSVTGFELPNGAAPQVIDAPAGWAGRFWARRDCASDSAGSFSCVTGDCGSGQVACNGNGGAPPTTLVEFTLQGDGGKDFYDVSLVDGFDTPVSVTPQGGSPAGCPSTACAAKINDGCPQELQVKSRDGSVVVGCKSACSKFNTDEYCCRGTFAPKGQCHPSTYSMMFKSQCPQAYSYAQDDPSSTFTCTGANYLITYCP